MIIRKMTNSDIETVAQIEKECFVDPWSVDTLSQSLENECYDYAVLVFNDEIIGYFCMHTLFDTSELFRVAVLNAYRRKGYGLLLIEKVLEIAREKGAEHIFLEVRAKNLSAIALYEKVGFIKYGERANYYGGGEDAYLYSFEIGGV
ncbi:MAG: ribosomal protein S18-alanine N-acetyltransferase [Clostridia bacterium]|nr:ribosomal protein S18-alanine N-acetyltransferase [Clostridia bacterium]